MAAAVDPASPAPTMAISQSFMTFSARMPLGG
jgi:hypothetical protein